MSSSNAGPARDDDGACSRGPAGAFPEGWYFVATLASLRKRRLIEKVWLGQDLPIGSSRRYTPRPILNRLDGEIMVFRRFCRQFYPGEPETPAENGPLPAVGS